MAPLADALQHGGRHDRRQQHDAEAAVVREHADPIADGDCDGRLQVGAVVGTPSPRGASHHLIAAILSKSGSAGSLGVEVAERAYTGPGGSLDGETDGGCVVCKLSVAGGQDRLVDLADGIGSSLALG